jgi:hypothetical protein
MATTPNGETTMATTKEQPDHLDLSALPKPV